MDTTATTHADHIISQLTTHTNREIATTWAPLVRAAITTWYTQQDMHAAIAIGGKRIEVGGHTISAQGVLDTIADALGDHIISQGSGFNDSAIFNTTAKATQ
jgi:hypothetical protein